MDKRWFFIPFVLFFALPMLKFMGPMVFLLPFLFFVFMGMSRRHGHGEWGWHCGPDGGHRDEMRKEKPKRQYVETVDGEYFEVIDEPQQA